MKFSRMRMAEDEPTQVQHTEVPDPPETPEVRPYVWPASHEHKLQPIGVDYPRPQPLMPQPTLVLFGCSDPECGWVETAELKGRWTMEQITKLNPKPEA